MSCSYFILSVKLSYQVRFDQMLYSNTKLRFLTEGLLLRQLQNDTGLHAYDLVILDEVCEIQGSYFVPLLWDGVCPKGIFTKIKQKYFVYKSNY